MSNTFVLFLNNVSRLFTDLRSWHYYITDISKIWNYLKSNILQGSRVTKYYIYAYCLVFSSNADHGPTNSFIVKSWKVKYCKSHGMRLRPAMPLKLIGSLSWRANISTFPVTSCVTVLWQSPRASVIDEDLSLPGALLMKDKRIVGSVK